MDLWTIGEMVSALAASDAVRVASTKAAGKFGEQATTSSWDLASKIVGRVRAWFSDNGEAESLAVLDAVEQAGDASGPEASQLAADIATKLKPDSAVARDLAEWLRDAQGDEVLSSIFSSSPIDLRTLSESHVSTALNTVQGLGQQVRISGETINVSVALDPALLGTSDPPPRVAGQHRATGSSHEFERVLRLTARLERALGQIELVVPDPPSTKHSPDLTMITMPFHTIGLDEAKGIAFVLIGHEQIPARARELLRGADQIAKAAYIRFAIPTLQPKMVDDVWRVAVDEVRTALSDTLRSYVDSGSVPSRKLLPE